LLQIAQICIFNIAVLVNTRSYAECMNFLWIMYLFKYSTMGWIIEIHKWHFGSYKPLCYAWKFFWHPLYARGGISVVSVTTRQWARRSHFQKCPDWLWSTLSHVFKGCCGSCRRGRVASPWSWPFTNTDLYLVPRLSINGAITQRYSMPSLWGQRQLYLFISFILCVLVFICVCCDSLCDFFPLFIMVFLSTSDFQLVLQQNLACAFLHSF
jgi:hypothetical protein